MLAPERLLISDLTIARIRLVRARTGLAESAEEQASVFCPCGRLGRRACRTRSLHGAPALVTLRLMARRRSLSSQLFRAARITDDIEAVSSGNPRRVARRTKNVVVGRALGGAGVWRRLWR
jgi:hypothetical protein